MMDLDNLDKAARSPWAAGALGSFVALRYAPGVTWLERVGNVISGAACAGFFAPALAEWLAITSQVMQSGMAFGVGMFGLSLAASITEGIRQVKFGDIINGWISRGGSRKE